MEKLIRHLTQSKALSSLVGDSEEFCTSIEPLPAVAQSDAPVLILGETGTGKELAARAIHYLSERDAFPFVPVNCGSLHETLLEDELFGHERGAFTDAHAGRRGLISQAEKGTLFLDEVDALTLRSQVALLRVIQDQKFRPVGSSTEQQANVRIITATNSHLDADVRCGRFRADLYYRLCVFTVSLPALRSHKEDIPALASFCHETHFALYLQGFHAKSGH